MKYPSAAWTQIAVVLFTSIITGSLLGGCVGIGVCVLIGKDPLVSLAYGPPAGALIGLMASVAFLAFSLSARKLPWMSFAAVAVVIAAGTAAANLVAGLPFGALFFIVIAVAEALGFVSTLFWLRSHRRWNERLKAYQDRAFGHDGNPVRP